MKIVEYEREGNLLKINFDEMDITCSGTKEISENEEVKKAIAMYKEREHDIKITPTFPPNFLLEDYAFWPPKEVYFMQLSRLGRSIKVRKGFLCLAQTIFHVVTGHNLNAMCKAYLRER